MSESTIKSYWRLLNDISLIALTLIGVYLVVQSGLQRASLSSQIARIENRIGEFPISDPRLVHIQALESENPLEFKWRIYFPANYKMARVQQLNSSGSSSGGLCLSNPTEIMVRVQFREINGVLECYSNFGMTSWMESVQQPVHKVAIQDKLEQLDIKQLGKDRRVTLDPDTEFTLLSIAMPLELLESMKAKFDDSQYENLSEEIIRVQFQK